MILKKYGFNYYLLLFSLATLKCSTSEKIQSSAKKLPIVFQSNLRENEIFLISELKNRGFLFESMDKARETVSFEMRRELETYFKDPNNKASFEDFKNKVIQNMEPLYYSLKITSYTNVQSNLIDSIQWICYTLPFKFDRKVTFSFSKQNNAKINMENDTKLLIDTIIASKIFSQ